MFLFYKVMVKDRKNYNQLTWRQIKRKIDKFKSIPEQYAEYLVQKGEIVLDDPTPLKKIKPSVQPPEVKTNLKKLKKKRKKPKLIKSIWQEETVNNELNNALLNNNNSAEDSGKEIVSNNHISGEPKLKLFSDDENDNNESNIESDISNSEDENSDSIE
jgi:hypothetical protein